MAGTRLQAAAEKGCLMGVPEGRAGPDDAGRAHGQRHKSVTSSRSPPRPQPFEELPPMPRTEHSPQLCRARPFRVSICRNVAADIGCVSFIDPNPLHLSASPQG